MEWTLTGLFLLSAILLIISIFQSKHAAKETKNQIDIVHISNLKELQGIQESIRNMELDMEVIAKESGIQLSAEEAVFMREILDLYKRNYSYSSIAELKEVPESEIKRLLMPYQKAKDERRKVANAN